MYEETKGLAPFFSALGSSGEKKVGVPLLSIGEETIIPGKNTKGRGKKRRSRNDPRKKKRAVEASTHSLAYPIGKGPSKEGKKATHGGRNLFEISIYHDPDGNKKGVARRPIAASIGEKEGDSSVRIQAN